MLLNCGVGEDSWESLELRGDPTSPPNGNQSWIFIGRTDAEAETLNTLAVWCEELTHWKRLWCWGRLKQEEKGTTEDQMIGWHHQVNGHEFKQAQGVGDGQGSLTWCSPWGHKESDTTEWLNWTEKKNVWCHWCSSRLCLILFSLICVGFNCPHQLLIYHRRSQVLPQSKVVLV